MGCFDVKYEVETGVSRMVDGEIYTINDIRVSERKTRDGATYTRIVLYTDKGCTLLPPRITARINADRGTEPLEEAARRALIGKTVTAEYKRSRYGNEYIAVYEEGGTGG